MNDYTKLALAIIQGQERVMGPIAWSEAGKVAGLTISDKNVSIKSGGKNVVEALVAQYETLFGLASVEACRDAVRSLLKDMKEADVPKILL